MIHRDVRNAIDRAIAAYLATKSRTQVPDAPVAGWDEAVAAHDMLQAVRAGQRALREGVAAAVRDAERATEKNPVWGSFLAAVFDVEASVIANP